MSQLKKTINQISYEATLKALQARMNGKLNSAASTSILSLMALGLTGCGGGGSGTTVPQSTLNGAAIKGPLSNALVFIDKDGDGELASDGSELWTTTNSDGSYSFSTTDQSKLDGDIVVKTTDDTIDTSSGATLAGLTLSAPQGSSVVTPLTTLIQSIAKSTSTANTAIDTDTTLSAEEKLAAKLEAAQDDVKSILGLAVDADVDLTTFNPFDTTDADSAAKVEIVAQQIVAVANTVAKTVESAGGDADLALTTAINSIADQIVNDSANFDLTNSTKISTIVGAVETATSTTIDASVDSAIAKVNTAVELVVENSNSLEEAKEVFNLAQESLVDAAVASVTDTTSASALASIDTTDATTVTSFTSNLISVTGKNKTILEADTISAEGKLVVAEAPDSTDGSYWIADNTSVAKLSTAVKGNLVIGDDGLTWTYTLTDPTTLDRIDGLQSPTFKSQDELSNADISYKETFEVTFIKVDADGNPVIVNGNPVTSALPKLITITINGVNDAPEMSIAEQALAVTEDVAKDFTISATDIDSATLTYTVTTKALHGTVSNTDGAFTYTPDENYYGEDTFVVTVSDGNGGTDTQTVKVTVANVEDEATGTFVFSGQVEEGGTVTAVLSASDVDDGIVETTYQWQISDNGTDGWTDLASATLTSYSIASDQTQVGKYLRLTATTTDAEGGTTTLLSDATAAIKNVNDNPVAENATGIIVGDSTDLIINKAYIADKAGISDVDGDTLTLSNVVITSTADKDGKSLALNGEIVSEGSVFTYSPTAVTDDTTVVLTYTVTDGNGGSDTGTLTLTIVDAIPLGTISEDLVDESGVPLPLADIKQTAAAALGAEASAIQVKDPDGNLMTGDYTPPANFNGTLTFTIVYDGQELPAVLGVSSENDEAQGSVSIDNVTPSQGETLTASDNITDSADGGIASRAYQWLADGVEIDNATASTFDVTQAEVGKAITVNVVATDGDGFAKTFTSSPTADALNVNDAPIGDVVITGSAVRGGTLTADTSAISDADNKTLQFSYQWKADGVAVTGETAKTLVLDSDDVGKVFTVEVVVDDGTYSAEANQKLVSAATDPVGAANQAPVVNSIETERGFNDDTPGTILARLTISDGNNDDLTLEISSVTQTFLDSDFTDSNDLSPTATERFSIVNNNDGTYDVVLAANQELVQSDYTLNISIKDGFGGDITQQVALDTAPAEVTVGKFTIEDGVNPLEWGLGFASFDVDGAAVQTDTGGSGNTISLTEDEDGVITAFEVTRPEGLVFSVSGVDLDRATLAQILTTELEDPKYNSGALQAFVGTTWVVKAADGVSGTILGAAPNSISDIVGTAGDDIFVISQFDTAGTQAIVDVETGAGNDWILVDWDTNDVVFGDVFISDFDAATDKLLFQMDASSSSYGHYMSALKFVEGTVGDVNYTQVFFDKNEDGDLNDPVALLNSSTIASEEAYGVLTFAGVTAAELKSAITIPNFGDTLNVNAGNWTSLASNDENLSAIADAIGGDPAQTGGQLYSFDIILNADNLAEDQGIFGFKFDLSLFDSSVLDVIGTTTDGDVYFGVAYGSSMTGETNGLIDEFAAVAGKKAAVVDNDPTSFTKAEATVATAYVRLKDGTDLSDVTLFFEDVAINLGPDALGAPTDDIDITPFALDLV